MKHPVYWFLISSGLMASTSLSFAAAKEETLNSSNSYNGNTAGNSTFTPKVSNDANGTIYNCEGDICIAYAGQGQPLSNSCFSDTTGDLTFTGKGYTLCFDNINTTAKPAAINVEADKTLAITGFSLFSCSFCPPENKGQGAVKSTGTINFDNNTMLLFKRNCSTENGGALSCKTLNLKNSSGLASFIENASDKKGGAIYCSDGDLKLENNQKIIFEGNTSKDEGGAIYAKKLTISSGAPIVFFNNSASKNANPKGGAISIASSGELNLEAKLGDIIFNGNTVVTSVAQPTTKRNAINIDSSGKFMKLNAKEGFGVFFYDPISNSGDTASTIEINKTDGSTTYSGKIVFSGEKLTEEERKVADNLKSTFKQTVKLGSGSLVLKDGVAVEAKSLEQTGGSVVMDLGTTLQTPSTDGDVITLTDLAINVASLGGGGVFLHQLKSQLAQPTKMLQSNLLI
ncbi:chemotaxis protein [Chlamydia crocodili]|uniref:chemotaxis protein n=1 Tax=Chlamydia TaxID=810 RepID=UPI002FCA4289